MWNLNTCLKISLGSFATLLAASSSNALTTPQVLRVDSGRIDQARAVTTDALGNAYVAGFLGGESQRTDFAVVKYDARGARVWTAQFNGSANGLLGEVRALAVDTAGNVFAVGQVATTNGITNSVDQLIVKFGVDGKQVWSKQINGSARGFDSATHAALDSAGNLYVSGIVSERNFDWLTQKYTSNGALLWERKFNGTASNNDIVTGLVLDAQGNAIVTGLAINASGVRDANDLATIKYDAQGNTLWQASFTVDAFSDERSHALMLDRSGNVFISAESAPDTSGELISKPLLIKYNNQGVLQFAKRASGMGGQAMTLDVSGNIVVAGLASGEDHFNDPGAGRPHVSVLDSAGNILRTTRLEQMLPTGVAVNALGEIFVAGTGAAGTTIASIDYFTVHLDASGAVKGVHRFNGSGNSRDEVAGMFMDANDNLYVTGVSPTSTLTSSKDIVTLKFPGNGTGLPPVAAAPAAPTNLVATTASRQVNLQWRDNADNERGFRIERCQGSNCSDFVQIAQVNANTRSFADSVLSRNTAYTYRLRSFNDDASSTYSNIIEARTPRF